MLKIRDLGTPVIFVVQNEPPTCEETETCDPSGQCVPSCEGASRAPGYHNSFSDSAVAQLREQLRKQLTR